MLSRLRATKKSKTSHTGFSAILLRRIENAIPHGALNLFQLWFTPSIVLAHQDLSKKLMQDASQALSEKMAEHLISNFTKLPNILYAEIENKNRDNAVVTLVFCVAMLRFLINYAPTRILNKTVSPYRYAFSFLKLNKADEFLYRESYRLFELGQLVTNTPHIVLNDDLREQLNCLVEVKTVSQETSQTTTPTSSEIQLVDSTSQEEDTAVIKENFTRWLTHKIKSSEARYAINEEGWVYCSPMKYPANTIFVTYELLNEYQKIRSILPNTVLASMNAADKQYFCTRGNEKVSLYKIDNIENKQTITKIIKIEEGSP